MKTTSATWTAVLLLSLLPQAFPADTKPVEDAPMGALYFKAMDVVQVLPIYAEMLQKKLVISPLVKKVRNTITLGPVNGLTTAEGLRLIEKALREQAGVVITKIDEKTVLVSYDDSLPVIVVPPNNPPQK